MTSAVGPAFPRQEIMLPASGAALLLAELLAKGHAVALLLGIGAAICFILAVISARSGRTLALPMDSPDCAHFRAAASCSQDALVLLKSVRDGSGQVADFDVTYLNGIAEDLLLPPSAQVVGRKLCDLIPLARQQGFVDIGREVLLTGQTRTTEFAVQSDSEEQKIRATWLRVTIVPLNDGLALSARDLTEQKNTESRILHMAQRDPLTGLANRTLLEDRIQQAIERANRYRHIAAVVMLDLDNFSGVSERYGQAAGDEVLRQVARRLRSSVRATDSVFRVGGDEFVIVLGDFASRGPVADFVRKIVVSLLPTIAWEGSSISVSASFGVATYPNEGATPESLLVHADMAMYRMKRGRHPKAAGQAALHDALRLPASAWASRAPAKASVTTA